MSRRDFLVEVGTEELPPKSLAALSAAFADGLASRLDAAGLAHGEVLRYATPRRLAVLVRRLAEAQPEQKVERRGPPVSAAFAADGSPTRAATAFAASCDVAVEDLRRIKEDKGEFLFHKGVRAGRPAADLLPGLVQGALDALPVARRMRWGDGDAQFVRPVHWLVMLHGGDVVDAEILGQRAGRITHGHRFHAPKPLSLRSPGTYAGTLEKRGHVLADFAARRERIAEAVATAARAAGGEPVSTPDLLDEVTALVEWPVAITGHFDPAFLELPPEVLIATLQDHQRYFPVRDGAGALLPLFVAVANIESSDPDQVRTGNERVVRPRLSDAAFFYATDRKTPLAGRAEALSSVTFQARLGSLQDKALRVTALASRIAGLTGADTTTVQRAAELCKCDLLSAMVGEFPELQGIMGRYYALHDGEPREVAEAIAEHYLPRYAGDALPRTPAGTALAIADRLDTIAGIFTIGQKPTGAKDPFGLRRAALGILRIQLEGGVELDLKLLIGAAADAVADDLARLGGEPPKAAPATVADEVYDYVMERLRAWYLEGGAGVTTEMFEAVLDRRPASPLDFDARLKALSGFLALPEAASLTAANKRIANILRKSGAEAGTRVDAGQLAEPAERALAEALEGLREGVESDLAARRYAGALGRLATLRPAVDAFFDGVLVMDPDPARRANRLALLAALQRLFQRVADLSRLPG